MDEIRQQLERLAETWQWAVSAYQNLPPEQQGQLQFVGLIFLVLFLVGLAYRHYGHNVVLGLPWLLIRVPLCALALLVVGVGRLSGKPWSVPEVIWRDWPRQPDPDAPRIPEIKAKPMQQPKQLKSGQIPIFGNTYDKVYSVGQIGEPGSGKDEAGIGPTLYHELVYGVDDVIFLDPKAEQIRRLIAYGLISPDDELYVFGSSPQLSQTDSFDVFAVPRPKTVLRVICEDPKNPHFGD